MQLCKLFSQFLVVFNDHLLLGLPGLRNGNADLSFNSWRNLFSYLLFILVFVFLLLLNLFILLVLFLLLTLNGNLRSRLSFTGLLVFILIGSLFGLVDDLLFGLLEMFVEFLT